MATATFPSHLDLPSTYVRRHLEDLGRTWVITKVHFSEPEAWLASGWTRAQ